MLLQADTSTQVTAKNAPYWVEVGLQIAAGQNIAWSVAMLLFPKGLLVWGKLPPEPWEWMLPLGLFVGVLGVQYWVASTALKTYWPWLAAVIALKIAAGGAVIGLAAVGQLPMTMGLLALTLELIWLPVFAAATYWGFYFWQDTSREGEDFASLPAALQWARTSQGQTVHQISAQQPVLLVFLRHFGCTFCREALADLAQLRPELEAEGTRLVLVHMANASAEGQAYLQSYGLADADHIADPTCRLYRAFSLRRASFGQVFGWASWWRGVKAGLAKGHGVGQLVGDGFQMPGVFLLQNGQVVKRFRHEHAAQVPDYSALAQCPVDFSSAATTG